MKLTVKWKDKVPEFVELSNTFLSIDDMDRYNIQDDNKIILLSYTNGKLSGLKDNITEINFYRITLESKYEEIHSTFINEENIIEQFKSNGFICFSFRHFNWKYFSHGDKLKIKINIKNKSLPLVYYTTYKNKWSLPTSSGLQFPMFAYGGVVEEDGIRFSLLFPAIAWGVQVNFTSKFTHLGFGVLIAPSIIEFEREKEKDMLSSYIVDRFTTAIYLDLSNWIWFGAGCRFDLSLDKKDFIFLITFSKSFYNKLFGN